MIPPLVNEFTTWNTWRCNCRCKYCFVYQLNEGVSGLDMTKTTANALLHFASHRLKKNGKIWFFGGEPLCDIDIMKYIVEKAQATPLAINFGLTTNCTLMTEDIARWMGENKFGILCSLDLSKDRHNKFRVYPDGSGTWDDAWRGLQHVRKYINKVPQIRATFGPGTIEGIADDAKGFVEIGLTNQAIGTIYEAHWSEEDLDQLRAEFVIFKEYMEQWIDEGTRVHSMWVRDGIRPFKAGARPWFNHCGMGQGSMGVSPQGVIYPCHRFVGSKHAAIGDVFDGFYPERLHWIKNWQRHPPYSENPSMCKTCSYKPACSGGCMASNFDIFKNVHILPTTLCRIKQLEVEIFGPLYKKYKGNETFKKTFLKKWEVRE